ncbi:hypothetical protein DBT_1276 [Dissulfuribacter thermophilus]|uniref:Uncharacterized protein n=1 Tax=Dissulfuribacter thermophilus TaxID=1156395 RepID=A0A1B9F5F9_9BACT|nr:hypothetical protein DBT_1276 [Dissulfuribacter thermophilus]
MKSDTPAKEKEKELINSYRVSMELRTVNPMASTNLSSKY